MENRLDCNTSLESRCWFIGWVGIEVPNTLHTLVLIFLIFSKSCQFIYFILKSLRTLLYLIYDTDEHFTCRNSRTRNTLRSDARPCKRQENTIDYIRTICIVVQSKNIIFVPFLLVLLILYGNN